MNSQLRIEGNTFATQNIQNKSITNKRDFIDLVNVTKFEPFYLNPKTNPFYLRQNAHP